MVDIEALGKLKVAIARLAHKYPLMGGLLAMWLICEEPAVMTMAVGMSADNFMLCYAPSFVREVGVDGLVAVLHHEVRHIIYGHPFYKAENYPDTKALTIAMEVTVNEQLPERLPLRGILLRDYPQLKPDQDTTTRYGLLAKVAAAQPPPVSGPGDGTEKADGAGADPQSPAQPGDDAGNTTEKADSGGASAPPESASKGSPADGTGSSKQGGGPSARHKKQSHSSRGAPNGAPKGKQVDSHDLWKEIKRDESFAKAILAAGVEKLIREGVKPTSYEQAVIEKAVKDRGHGAGGYCSELGESDRKTLSWQTLLRQYVGQQLERAATYLRPNRRFPDLVGVVPGQYSSSARPKVMACIDTSGSMTDGELADISKELRTMAQKFEVHVVECDCVIHRHYRFKGPIKTVLGRGGTSFVPPLEAKFLKKIKPDLVIFFTDGDGEAPEEPPKVPVIWVLTHGEDHWLRLVPVGCSPAKWGRVIHMYDTPPAGM